MYSLHKHVKHTINLNVFEKLCVLTPLNRDIFLNSFSIEKLKINFTLKNNSSNKIMFLSHLILLEKLIGQKLKFVKSTEHNQNFNIRRGTKIGCTLTIRKKKLILFLFYFINYSLRKINLFNNFSFKKSALNKLRYKMHSHLYFSINKILFFFTLSNHPDWNQFSYVYDETIYGLDLQFQTNYINPYVNRLILSHYGLLII